MIYRPEIDGLRAVAVLSVVLAHAGITGLSGGYVGVDIFFVISGYLITSILAKDLETGRYSLLEFYERRLRRILPALLFLLAALAVKGFFLFPPWQYEALSSSMLATIAFVSNLYLMDTTGGYFGENAYFQPLMHTWSLGVEEQFYIVFPIGLAVVFRAGKRVATAGVAVLVAGSYLWTVLSMPEETLATFFLPQFRAWELGAGALLALISPSPPRSRLVADLFGTVGLVLIAGCVAVYDDDTVFPGLTALPVVIGSVLIIWSSQREGTVIHSLLALALLVRVGQISYSLYLWHWPPIVAAQTFANGEPSAFLMAGALVFAFAAAWASWRFVERPFRHRTGPQAFDRRQIFRMAAVGMASLAGVALVVGLDRGMKFRVPAEQYQSYRTAIQMSEAENRCRDQWFDDIAIMCGIGLDDGGAPSVLLWGDSHAAAFIPGVDAWLAANDLTGGVFVADRCPPLPGLINRHLSWAEDCIARNAAVLEVIRETPHLRTILIAGRWTLSYHGTRFGAEAEDSTIVAIETEDGVKEGPDAMEAAARALLDELKQLDRQAVVLGSVPEMGFHVPRRFLDDVFFGRVSRDTVPSAATLARTDGPDSMFERITRSSGGELVRFSRIFCDTECVLRVKGTPFYRDDDHVSAYGSEWAVFQGFEQLQLQAAGSGVREPDAALGH